MIGEVIQFKRTSNGLLLPENGELSDYQPKQDVQEITRHVKRDYQIGNDVFYTPFREFDNKSVLNEMNENQKAFLIHSDIDFIDPDDEWRWDGVRPTVRNKILSLAAHLTSSVLIPGVFAQNDQDEEDKQTAEIMKAILEWNIRNSDYEISFLNGVIAGLVNPVAYLSVDYFQALQEIKVRSKDGTYRLEKIVDEVLSGLQVGNVPLDEVLITNPYEYNIQKQRAIGRRRYIDYVEAEAKYGGHDNFGFVKPGIKTIYNEEDQTFYDQKNDNIDDTLVEEFVYYNRREDLEIPFINGIYHGETDVQANPINHRDQKNRPMYNLVKFGSEPIDEKKFFFYKSIASKMMSDWKLANRTWRIVIDTATLGMKPPIGVAGNEKLESDIYYPGRSVSMGKDTRFTQLPTGNSAEGYNLLNFVNQDINESTQDPRRQGLEGGKNQTAFEFARLEQNARIQLGLIGKMMVQMVKDLGGLMIDCVIHNQTVGEVQKLLAGQTRLKFMTFIFPNQREGGSMVTKEIRLTDELIGMEMDEKQMMKRQQALYDEEGGEDAERRIVLVNPSLFRKLKFQIVIDATELMPQNEALEQALKLEAYSHAIQNPLIASDIEALRGVTRDLLLNALRPTKGNEDKYLPKQQFQLPIQMPNSQSNRENPISKQMVKSNQAGAFSDLMMK